MNSPLQILHLEDNPRDAALVEAMLETAGITCAVTLVKTRKDFQAAIEQDTFDLIISDFSLPMFDGLAALKLARQIGSLKPFIFVSGTMGEEVAVESLKQGATDYVLKDRLGRLGTSVKRALREAEAEAALTRLRHQNELILNSAGEGIYGLDLDGNIIFENPKAAELLGWKAAELLGMPAHATIHHKHADGSPYPIESCPIHASMVDGATQRVTNDVFWRKDGTHFRVDYVSAPIRDEQGNLTGSIITFKDITEQFFAEARQKLQAEQYRLLFETNPNPMWVFDRKTLQILATNEAATTQYGYSRSEFLKLTLKDLHPAEELPDFIEATALSFPRPPSQISNQFRHLKKDGSLMLVETYSGPIIWGGVAARIVTIIDVTERKRAEERVREQADIIDRAHDAIIVRDFATDHVIVWNKGAERLYGWSASEAFARPFVELIFAESNNREMLLEQLVSTGEFHGEVKHRAKGGGEVIVNARVTLVRNDDGTPRSVLEINTDITEQKNLETHLLRAQRLESIGTLASGVAHDLNNVLTPILMCADLLRNDVTTADSQSTLSLIEQSAQRGAAIVKQVLTFARGVEGERVIINPTFLIEEIIDIAKKTFPKSIQFSSRYSEGLWAIEGDPTQLHQVLLNLSVNARDAMPNGGSLVFGAENFRVDEHYASMMLGAKPGPHVMLQVSDSGDGVPQAHIDKIFDPFFSTKEAGKGTGLGLSTALGIVKSHGGFLAVYSEVKAGTTFKVFLPAQPNETGLYVSQTPAEMLMGNSELVLVIDDEPAILSVTRMILEQHNYRVLAVSDGPEALAMIAQQGGEICLVITDISMPLIDGVALIRTIKKMRPSMPFIASTGQAEQERLGELEALGVKTFLSKPYNAEKLLERIRQSIGSIR